MASEAQVRANRANALKSTGPRTAGGKAVVAQNAIKHGFRAERIVIQGEDPGVFEFYREQMLAELAPAGAVETMLAERVVGLAWRLRRAERMQAEAFETMFSNEQTDPARKFVASLRSKNSNGPDDDDSALGRVVVRDFGGAQVLYRLGLYERRIEHSLYKSLSELQRARLLRDLDEPAIESPPKPPARTNDGPAAPNKPNFAPHGAENAVGEWAMPRAKPISADGAGSGCCELDEIGRSA